MDTPEILMRRALAQKELRRKRLAALPYAEKIRLLLRLQRMADVAGGKRGVPPRAWQIDERSLMPLNHEIRVR